MRGIILAGGSGTRLHPMTQAISKQLMPVYDKPMVYYPLSTLMMAGIREVLVITTPRRPCAVPGAARRRLAARHRDRSTPTQPRPEGLAQAFLIGADFIGGEDGRARAGRQHLLRHRSRHGAADSTDELVGGTIFAYHVSDPSAYGVVEFDDSGKVISIEEKPAEPKQQLRRPRAVLLRQRRRRDRGRQRPERARRAGDHRRSTTAYLRRGTLSVQRARARHGLARHRHSRLAHGSGGVRTGDRAAAGPQDRLHRGDRLAIRLRSRRAAAARWPSHCARAATASTWSASSWAKGEPRVPRRVPPCPARRRRHPHLTPVRVASTRAGVSALSVLRMPSPLFGRARPRLFAPRACRSCGGERAEASGSGQGEPRHIAQGTMTAEPRRTVCIVAVTTTQRRPADSPNPASGHDLLGGTASSLGRSGEPTNAVDGRLAGNLGVKLAARAGRANFLARTRQLTPRRAGRISRPLCLDAFSELVTREPWRLRQSGDSGSSRC